MDDTVASQIEDIRRRLAEIADEREHLATDETDRRDELLDEERKLEIRLAELEDQVAEDEAGGAVEKAAAQTDLTRTPKLPDTDENDQE